MDANGLRFWLLADREDWAIAGAPAALQYDSDRRTLQLASRRELALPPEAEGPAAEAIAQARLEQVPQARDSFDTRAFWDPVTAQILATGAVPGTVPIYVPPLGERPSDLALGFDGVLAVAIAGRVVLLDRRERWEPVTLTVPGFTAWRLAADPAGGFWVLNRAQRQLGRIDGQPLPDRPVGLYDPDTFRPCEENPNPSQLTILAQATWPADETPVAIACSPAGRLALLTWVAGDSARVRCLTADRVFGPPTHLLGARFPYSLTWVSTEDVAILLTGLESEAPVFTIGMGDLPVHPSGDLYPLRDHSGGPFVHGLTLPPHYPVTRPEGTAPLHHLSLPSFARDGTAVNRNRQRIDSGHAATVWHRLYLEAVIPPKCGIRVLLAAGDDPDEPANTAPSDWHEHRFGELFAPGDGVIPRGAWVPYPSELPFHPGLLPADHERDRCGLFTVLIQRSNRRVRSLRGRYLQVRVELIGDGRSTPEVAALRAYGDRFSYRDRYLPELYGESLFGPEADEPIPADQPKTSTPADFLERFLDNFEGVLTPLEDRIAGSYLLTDPRTAPDEALEWLGHWIGIGFDSAYPKQRRRQMLQAAPDLCRQRGTYEGLRRALDVATGDAVTGGEIIILEDFRLRRTFATILGADLADESDPLLAGLVASGNSFVGDSLILGVETRREFLALFAADLPVTDAESAAIAEFFDRLAHRVTVLVHEAVEAQDLGLIRRTVAAETPAHVEARVLTASTPFLVAVASLVGVDTYLARPADLEPVRVNQSRLGAGDRVTHLPSLDPRLETGSLGHPALVSTERPLADAGPDLMVDFGESFILDATNSRAGPGRRIARYVWTLTN